MLGTAYLPSSKGLPMPDISIIRDMNRTPPRRQPPRGPVERDAAASQEASTQPSPAWIEQLLRANIVVSDAESVARFVTRFPDAARAMDDGLSHIRRHFPDADRLVLETFDEGSGSGDPNEQTLLLVVELKSPAPDALNRLEQLDEVWWYRLPPQTKLRVAAHVTLR